MPRDVDLFTRGVLPPPREVTWAMHVPVVRWVALVVQVLLVVGAIKASLQEQRRRELEEGPTVTGTVTEWHKARTGRGSVRLSVSYRYSVGRTEYADRTEVASQAYESVPVGGPCEVRYREAEPSYHRLEAPAPSGPPQRARDVWPIFLLLESLLVAGLLIFKRVVCRERALARDGEVAAARIIERGQEPGGSKSPPRYWVRYEFLGPAGRTESGRRFLPQPVWDLYTVGAAVPLLFTTEPRLRHRLLASITHVRFEGMTEAALAIIPAGHPHPEHDRRGPRP